MSTDDRRIDKLKPTFVTQGLEELIEPDSHATANCSSGRADGAEAEGSETVSLARAFLRQLCSAPQSVPQTILRSA